MCDCFVRPLLGTWALLGACALTGNLTMTLSQSGAQSTEPQQPGLDLLYYIPIYKISDRGEKREREIMINI